MKTLKLIFLYMLLFIVTLASGLYLSFLYIAPIVVNSNLFQEKIEKITNYKLGLNLDLQGFKIKTYPSLKINLKSNEINLSDKNEKILTIKNINSIYDIKKLNFSILNAENFYLDVDLLQNYIKRRDKKENKNFNFDKIPEFNIKHGEILLNKSNEKILISITNLITNKIQDKTYINFEAQIFSKFLKGSIKIPSQNKLYIKNNTLYSENFQIYIDNSSLFLNGKLLDKNNKFDINITGKNIPVSDIQASLLYFQKLKSKSKKFIENFYNFKGNAQINLKVNNNGAFGLITVNNLSAITRLFDVPIFFDKVDFKLSERTMSTNAYGLLGGEKVHTSFILNNIATKEQEVTGNVNTILTNELAKKYIPNFYIKGKADTKVTYKVKNKKVYVDYLLTVDKNSDLIYKDAYLGLIDKKRRLLINTIKEIDNLKITHYDYSTIENNNIENILTGEGLFQKEKNHLKPAYITTKTNGYAPISVTGSFGKYLLGGEFDGDLKYDFNKNLLTGDFSLINSHYNKFFIEKAKINADEKTLKLDANGEYYNSKFNCNLTATNKLSKKINIENMDLFLDEFEIKSSNKINNNPSKTIMNLTKTFDVDIQNWRIKLNKLKRKRVELTDILINGKLIDDIFTFYMQHVYFADGKLSANGTYNYNNKSSDIFFTAENINSNTVADVIFDLPNQIEGSANATLHAILKHNFDDINAYATFSIKDGLMPQLGSTEFIIKKSKKNRKIKLSDIINIDIKNMKALSSDLDGSFCFNDDEIYNAKITSTQKFLSMLIEGKYNIEHQNADLNLYGKYNNQEISRVKILFIPLSYIVKFVFKEEKSKQKYQTKLNEIPKITATQNETSYFRVKMQGNLNKNDIKVELKSII
jgi:hypothetical protein